jgi:hypothetical protein
VEQRLLASGPTVSIVGGEVRSVAGLTVAVTGYLDFGTHEEARRVIQAAGGHYSDEVTGTTDLLVRGEPNTQYKFVQIGVKIDRARALGVPIVWSADFRALIDENVPAPTTADADKKRVRRPIGADYRPAKAGGSNADPFLYDPKARERGTRAHREMQELVADAAAAAGYRVLSPTAMTPQYDLAWVGRGKRVVCEVKSLTATNEPHQIRFGLGQVLDYRHAMSHSGSVFSAALAVSREPEDARWERLCRTLNVHLVWPESVPRLFAARP